RDDFDAMIELWMGQNFEAGMNGAAAGIVCAVDQPWHTCLNHGSCAHGARLESYVERRARKTIIIEEVGGFADNNDFGVGSRVVVADSAIAGASDDFVFVYEQSTDRDFACARRSARFFEGELHVIEVCRHGKGKNNMRRRKARIGLHLA